MAGLPPLYPSLPSLSPSLSLCSLCKKMSVAFCGFVSGFRIAFCLRFASVTRHAHPWQPSCLLPPRLPSLRFCSICCHLLRRLHVLRCSIIKELTCRLRGFIAGDLSQRPPLSPVTCTPLPLPECVPSLDMSLGKAAAPPRSLLFFSTTISAHSFRFLFLQLPPFPLFCCAHALLTQRITP